MTNYLISARTTSTDHPTHEITAKTQRSLIRQAKKHLANYEIDAWIVAVNPNGQKTMIKSTTKETEELIWV